MKIWPWHGVKAGVMVLGDGYKVGLLVKPSVTSTIQYQAQLLLELWLLSSCSRLPHDRTFYHCVLWRHSLHHKVNERVGCSLHTVQTAVHARIHQIVSLC